jgi:hypothetical protein
MRNGCFTQLPICGVESGGTNQSERAVEIEKNQLEARLSELHRRYTDDSLK